MAKTGYFDDEEEWWKQFAFLTPAEQAAVMGENGYQGSAQAAPFSYAPGGNAEDPLGWAEIDASMNGYAPGGNAEDPYGWAAIDAATRSQSEPAQTEALPFNYYGSGLSEDFPINDIVNMPEFTASGNLDPFDLSQQVKRLNYGQDYMGLMVDNVLSMLGGPGSYGPDAFTPTIEYGKELNRPGNTWLDQTAGTGGWEGFIADEYKRMGVPNSSAAVAAMRDFVERVDPNDPELTQQERDQIKSITTGLPSLKADPVTGESGGYDWDTVQNVARDYAEEIRNDPTGWQDEATGKWYDKEPVEVKTGPMEWYDKYGIPYQNVSYTDPQILDRLLNAEEGTTPEYRAQEAAAYNQEYQGAKAATSRATSQEQQQGDLDRELLAAWEAAQPTATPTTQRGPGFATVPGSAGVDINTQFAPRAGAGAGGLLPQVAGRTATDAQLPTSVMLPGRGKLTSPERPGFGTGLAPGWGNFRGVAKPTTPMVRELANGQAGLIGRNAELRPNMGQGFGVFKAREREDPAFAKSFFKQAPKGSTDRKIKAKDVDRKAIAKRATQAGDRSMAAYRARAATEERDPRLNDLARAAELYMLAKAGRTPTNDTLAQRRLAASRMGL